MLDPTFLRPIAHRGLHDAAKAVIENTPPAFEAAVAKGYAIECDIVAAAAGLPIVFHDDTLDRLTEATGPVSHLGLAELRRIRFRGAGRIGIPTFAEFLDLCGPRVPLIAEIKSDWRTPDPTFLREVARLAVDHPGPIALMSFDPAIMAALAPLAPGIPRGLVSGGDHDEAEYASRRRGLLRRDMPPSPHPAPTAHRGFSPDFHACEVGTLSALATRLVRSFYRRPILAWTVRSDADRATALRHADAPIFEGLTP